MLFCMVSREKLLLSLRKHVCVPRSKNLACVKLKGCLLMEKTEPELISKSGKHHVTLSFAPIPAGVHAVDFVEKEEGWIIWGVQLSKAEPYVYIPSFFAN